MIRACWRSLRDLVTAWRQVQAERLEAEKRRQFQVQMDKLQLAAGDVLIVYVPKGCPEEQIRRVRAGAKRWLQELGLERCRSLVVEEPLKLDALTEERMAAYGWVRARKAPPAAAEASPNEGR